MFNETEIKMITLSIAVYTTFFMYSVTGNPMMELLYTVLTMINVAAVTHLSSKMEDEEKEIEVNYDIYDDAPINSSDDEEGDAEADDEVETEAEEEQKQEQQQDLSGAPTDLSGAPTDLSGATTDLSGSNVKEEALSAASALLAAIAELSGTVTMASNDLSGNIFSPESFRDAPLVPRQTPAEI